jgi:hypothetical protein
MYASDINIAGATNRALFATRWRVSFRTRPPQSNVGVDTLTHATQERQLELLSSNPFKFLY